MVLTDLPALGMFEILGVGLVGDAGIDVLRDDLTTVLSRYNRATDGTAVLENTYLQIVAVRER